MGQRIKRLNIELGPFEVLSSSLRDLLYPREKNIPLYQCADKNPPFFGHIEGTPRPPTPLSCPLSALASVAERLPPSPYNPKVPGSNPGADLFFFFWVSQGLPKASSRLPQGLPGFFHCESSSRGSNTGPSGPVFDPRLLLAQWKMR